MATEERYQGSLHAVFPPMLPVATKELCDAGVTEFGAGLTKEMQAARQAGAMILTFVVAIVGGLVTGESHSLFPIKIYISFYFWGGGVKEV